MLRSLPALGVLASLAVLASPIVSGIAQAAGPLSAEVTSDTLVVEGSARGDRIYVNFEDPATIQVSVSDMVTSAPATLAAGAGCRAAGSSAGRVDCSTAGVTRVIVRAGDGDDLVFTGVGWRSQNANFVLPVEYYGGNGRDDLRGGPGNDKLFGEGGNDSQIMGDLGADSIYGGDGDDVNLRGEGTGITPAQFQPDLIDGGAGIDTFDEQRVGLDRWQFWSLDGVANDGSDLDDNPENGAEEGDNIMSSVENVIGSSNTDVIIGSAADNVIIDSFGVNLISTGDGDDEIRASLSDSIIGSGPGDDIIVAGTDASVDAGTGNDDIVAGGFIDAGPGRDKVTGRDFNDYIVATDDELDLVSCGGGADVVYADSLDVLATDLLCELEVGKVGVRKLLPGSINLTVAQPGNGSVVVTVLYKGVALGTSTVTSIAPGDVAVSIPLTAGDRKRLKALKSLPVSIRTSFRATGGDTALLAERKVTLRR